MPVASCTSVTCASWVARMFLPSPDGVGFFEDEAPPV
jgi:hypothetical protein